MWIALYLFIFSPFFPHFRNRTTFFNIIHHQDQLVLMIAVDDLDIDAG